MVNKKISIFGIVQGVGFRPYIYNLARKHKINGWVRNDENGVEIEAYAKKEDIENFINEIKSNPPVLAKITNIKIEKNNQIRNWVIGHISNGLVKNANANFSLTKTKNKLF